MVRPVSSTHWCGGIPKAGESSVAACGPFDPHDRLVQHLKETGAIFLREGPVAAGHLAGLAQVGEEGAAATPLRRQGEPEGGAPLAIVEHADLASLGFDEALADVEAKAGALFAAGGFVAQSRELAKDLLEILS